MGIAMLAVLVSVEAGFLIWSVISKNAHAPKKHAVRMVEFAVLVLLLVTGICKWGFGYCGILIVLGIQAILSMVALIRKRNRPYALRNVIAVFLCNVLLYIAATLPAILFPQYTPVVTTGHHAVAMAGYVWTDASRVETFADTGANRNVDVAFWYPKEAGKYPLVVFSHGAFGFNMSNFSTFEELASNGYVVASIGHAYHAFYTKDASGRPVIADMDFIRSVYALNALEDGDEKQTITDGWMNLRLGDERFVLDAIAESVKSGADELFDSIDPACKIGLFGHSLGGAAAAQLGRERTDIGAVINLDGTMLGETLGYDERGEAILNDEPYPVPLLNVYTGDHYSMASSYGERYPNFHAANRAAHSYAVVFKDAGHLNFTDLPLLSPALGKLLGTGTIDARYAIERMNAIILQFFDYALKGGPQPQFESEYSE